MPQVILDILEVVLKAPVFTMLVGTLLGSLLASQAYKKQLKSASDSERRKHLRSILAKILAHQRRLMDRQYEIYQDIVDEEELEQRKGHTVDYLNKPEFETERMDKAKELIRPINDAFHELLAELEILTDIPNDLYLEVACRCGISNMTMHLEDTVEDNRIKESVKQDTPELIESSLYLNAFQSIRRPWMNSLLVAIHAVLKHTEK